MESTNKFHSGNYTTIHSISMLMYKYAHLFLVNTIKTSKSAGRLQIEESIKVVFL